MTSRILMTLAVATTLASSTVFAAPQDAGARIATAGNGSGAPPCVACHGADGGGQEGPGFPRLAGLNAAYMQRQLDDFANGSRESAVMKPIATALSTEERKIMATYYANLPIPEAAKSTSDQKDNARGRRLAERGRWEAQVPGCVQCHGPHGVGVGEHFPAIAGQPATYIANQLDAWKKGTRKNDPLDLMKHVAASLDEKDIQAVSEWFAAQSPEVEGGRK